MNAPGRTLGDPRRTALIVAALVVLTIAAYWHVGACGFVSYDDPTYVVAQPMVNQGLRGAAICWAFTAPHGANWHPLTSLTHMLDCSLFGVNAGPQHWVNVLWHVLNTALVFVVWQRLSGAAWPSAFVAALFALHPLHVESVAWISERKDVVSTAFWLLALWAYGGYVARPSSGRYALVALGLVLGLMAKPMVVTLPCTLLLLDYWPLQRWPQRSWRALVREKLPLFALAGAFSVVTFVVQRAAGATEFGTRFTLMMRLGNALVSYVRYLGSAVWPVSLAPFHPHPGYWPWWAVLGSLIFLGAVSWLAWASVHAPGRAEEPEVIHRFHLVSAKGPRGPVIPPSQAGLRLPDPDRARRRSRSDCSVDVGAQRASTRPFPFAADYGLASWVLTRSVRRENVSNVETR